MPMKLIYINPQTIAFPYICKKIKKNLSFSMALRKRPPIKTSLKNLKEDLNKYHILKLEGQ